MMTQHNQVSEALPPMTVMQWLNSLRPAIPLSIERGEDKTGSHRPMSNSELRRHIQQGAVLVNGERVGPHDEVNFPVFSLVFFPKSAVRRTTL